MNYRVCLVFLLLMRLSVAPLYAQPIQVDTEFCACKKKGDDCLTRKDYDCAERFYQAAIILKANDTYCKSQLILITKQRQSNKLISDVHPTNDSSTLLAHVMIGERKWGLINRKDNLILLSNNYSEISYLGEGLSAVIVRDKLGLINKTGQIVSSIQHPPYYIGHFSEGLCVMPNKGGGYGYINKTGRFIIPPKFDGARDLSEGLAAVEQNFKWGFINKTGELIIPPQFDNIGLEPLFFSEGLAAVKLNEKWGYINKTGKFVVQPYFEEAYNFSGGIARVSVNGKYGYINQEGKFLIKPQFSYSLDFSDGLAQVSVDGEKGYIDTTGQFVVTPKPFIETHKFSEGLAGYQISGKWGFINTKGQFVIQPQFNSVRQFSEGLAGVQINRKWGFIDKSGVLVIQPQFEYVADFRY